jgi:molecular chaperone DnaK (HSP70)
MKWGFQIPESQSRYHCFKLELEPSVARTTSHLGLLFPDPKALRIDHRNNGERLNSDYLTCLRKHVTDILKISLCANVLETTAVEFIITVPAIWSEAAQAKTMSCAKRASMDAGLKLILEPEAAIMHAVDQELSPLKVSDIVVVCDAGRGTVDLISYMIDQLRPILEVSEAAPGTGGACGNSFLNRMFAQLLHQRRGHLPAWADDTLQEALDYFENRLKRKFNGSNDRWLIPVPGLTDNGEAGIKRWKLSMLGGEISSLFDPIINTITSLVQMQINISNRKGAVKIVYLVGGFGESAYLRESLKKVVPEGIQVISPTNSWTAIVRGALIKGLAETLPLAAKFKVGSGVARKAYGIVVSSQFRAGVHQQSRK